MELSLIVAMDSLGGIGINNSLPWRGKVPSDMQRFVKLTSGHTIIMGRKTFESFGGRLLPNRRHIIVSRNTNFSFLGTETCASREAVMEAVKENSDEVFVIGGTEIYELFLPLVSKLYITVIQHQFAADAYFPELSSNEWEIIESSNIPADEKNNYEMLFLTLKRTRPK